MALQTRGELIFELSYNQVSFYCEACNIYNNVYNIKMPIGMSLLALIVGSAALADLPESPAELRHPEPGKTVSTGLDLPALESRAGWETLSNWPPAESTPDVDVQHYDLDLAFDVATGNISGTATITVVWGHPGDNLTLDVRTMTVTAARKVPAGNLVYSQTSSELDIIVTPAPAQGETVSVEVDYNAIPSQAIYGIPSSPTPSPNPTTPAAGFPAATCPGTRPP